MERNEGRVVGREGGMETLREVMMGKVGGEEEGRVICV